MTAVIGALRANLSASVAEFQSDLGKAADGLKNFSKNAKAVASEIEHAGARMSFALTAPLALFGKQSLDVARTSKQALGQVEAALLSTGDASGKTADQLEESATQLEKISAFDKRDILKGVTANLLTFTNVTGATFDRAQKLIVDFAARTGTDLPAATIKWGRALNDPIQGVNALTRAGVQFDTQTKLNIKSLVQHGQGLAAQNIILEAGEKKFHGAAQAMHDADPEQVFKNHWADFEETIGRIEAQILPKFTDVLQNVLDKFQALSPETQKNIVMAAGLAAAIGPLLVVLGSAIRVVAALATGLRVLAVAAAANPWIALIAIIALAIGAYVLFNAQSDKTTDALSKQAAAHKDLNTLLDLARTKGAQLSQTDAIAAKNKLKLAEATLKAALAQQIQNEADDKGLAFGLYAKTSFGQAKIGADEAGVQSLQLAIMQNQRDQAALGKAPVAPAGAGGGGAPPNFDPHNMAEIQKAQAAAESLSKQLDELQIKLQRGLDDTNVPKAVADANQLNAQLDEYVKNAQAAGANTGQFQARIASLRATIEQLKIAELAKEAQKFAEVVNQDAIAVDRFAKGGLPPLQEKLQDVDDQFRALRDKITDEIEANRVLAASNSDAAAAMARLEAQLARLEGAHIKATAAARANYAAEKAMADLQAAGANIGTAQTIQELLQSSGRANAPISTAAADLQSITNDLLQKQNQAAQDQLKLENELADAQRKGDTDAIARLNTQLQLATQYHTLISNTTAEQIQAAQRVNEAFKTFSDTLTQQLSDSLVKWQFDLKSLDDTFGQLAENLFVKPFVQSGVDQLSGFIKDLIPGLGGKPDGTATNPLNVTMAPGVGSLTGDLGAGGGSSGGIFGQIGSWISGLFGSGGGASAIDASAFMPFAAGGFLPPGKWGVAGEEGPEPIFGGKTGVTVQSARANGPVTQVFNIGRMDQDTFHQTRRQFARTARGAMQ